MSTVSRMARQRCTVRYHQPAGSDGRVDQGSDWTEVETVCQLQQRGRNETNEGEVSQTTWLVTFPRGTPAPRGVDELVIDGITYQFRGDSWPASNSRGQLDHIEATAVRAE